MASRISLLPSARVEPSPSGSFSSSTARPPILNSQNVAAHLQSLYNTKLNELERDWRDRYTFFLEHGLELRPRYRPGWTPSWLGTTLDPAYCTDSIEQILYMVLDAKRLRDGTNVCIKRIEPESKTEEVNIARYLSSAQMLRDPNNHCVPVWDSFRDPILPHVEYLVMPILRPFDSPEFCAIGEVVDFVTQLLEGMEFMHRNLVAHGDLTTQNIMMDARPILPGGWHFVADMYAPNGHDELTPLTRSDHPVRYFVIDYDCSLRLRPGQPHLVTEFGGRDGDPPEYTSRNPYDPFKIDVFTLGNVFYKDFYQKYEGLEFLASLIDFMKTRDFRQRPTAQVALQYWYNIRTHLDVAIARWRLRRRNESFGERVVLDTVAVARQSIHSVKRLLGSEKRKAGWSNT
ncbi:hypothetical protein Hypma_012977 [Hypsizygus marmoreus]|uniref:Protein kinase domain-containing protein n=1 Tax=Hypsizygus marmoreus TaxID=39966 RepID=A0A369JFR6_HYPMA|nr:hypothetical protein Hypma_012977 [Hypsizygus marmoreus]